METKEYTATDLAYFLHSFPHVDLAFQNVNKTFNLASSEYKESLVFWAGVPVVFMLVTLFIIIMYFCYRCCQREVETTTNCIKWAISILALLSCSAVGAGFYGNEEAQKGLHHFIEAATDVQETINLTDTQLIILERDIIDNSVVLGVTQLRQIIESSKFVGRASAIAAKTNGSDPMSTVHSIVGMSNTTLDIVAGLRPNVDWIKGKANRVTFGIIQEYATTFGFYRWLIMVLLLSWLMVVFVLLMFALIKATKCVFLIIGALCILSLILCWVAAGFHLGVSVAMGDFCSAPHAYFEDITRDSHRREITKYYITCNRTLTSNPFRKAFMNMYALVESANVSIASVLNATTMIADTKELKLQIREQELLIYKGFDNAVQTLMHLNALMECTNLHKAFFDGLEGICRRGLPGLMFLIVSEFLTGLFFTGLVLVVAGSWKSFVDRRDKQVPKTYVDPTEEDGPFLLSRDTSTPSYYSFLPGCRGIMNEQMQLQKQNSVGSPGDTMMSPPGYNGMENHQNQNSSSNMARLNDASL